MDMEYINVTFGLSRNPRDNPPIRLLRGCEVSMTTLQLKGVKI